MPIILPQILMVQRAERFSQNAVEKDLAILQAVGDSLLERGASVNYVKEELLENKHWKLDDRVGVIFSMARSEKALSALQHAEAEGVIVINNVRSIDICNSRRAVDSLMRSNHIPTAPYYQQGAGWIKADTGHDVRFAANEEEMLAFKQQVDNPLLTAHVEGTSVKFYGVADYFFSPADFVEVGLAAARLARLIGIQIYGGDAIVRSDGTFAIIDFNDWPSFSACREEAAAAICNLI